MSAFFVSFPRSFIGAALHANVPAMCFAFSNVRLTIITFAPAPVSAITAAFAAPPAPITTAFFPASEIPFSRKTRFTPAASVLKPLSLLSSRIMAFTAPISRAASSTSSRNGIIVSLNGEVTLKLWTGTSLIICTISSTREAARRR